MNILFDDKIFEFQEKGGISRYHIELYKGLIKSGINAKIGIRYSDNIYLRDYDNSIKKQFGILDRFLPDQNFKGKYRLYQMFSVFHRIKNSRELNMEYIENLLSQNFDIFHPTTYTESYDNITKPIVITIHDMIHESHPEFFCSLQTIKDKSKIAQKANKIIAISEYTKEEILRYYNFIDPHKISVVYHGICLDENENFYDNEFKFPYLLYVGSRAEYKNFSVILKALSQIKENIGNLKLLCVGTQLTNNELIYIEMLGLSDVVLNKNNVTDKRLRSYYKYAEYYISSSIVEGFGLPLLEAMKYKSPMILSDIPVYREIASDAAAYFDPYNVSSLVDIMKDILNTAIPRDELKLKGINRVRLFALDNMINNTVNVYKSLM